VKRKKKLTSGKRSKSQKATHTSFRSRFEENVAKELEKHGWQYESEKIIYTIPESEHKYTPDFSKKETCVETKGRFVSRAEAEKYIHIRSSNQDRRLVFVFQNPNCPMPGAKRRKDGTIFTMADWAERWGFDYFTLSTLSELESEDN
jgi:hypothetical protein